MSAKILFVSEGPKEGNQFEKIQKYFSDLDGIVHFVFEAEIYQLFKLINEDTDLDIFPLIKERISSRNPELKDFKRTDFDQIYYFFDYDGHATQASDEKIIQMLELFNEETNNGRLFISYPMIESFYHIENTDDSFQNLTVKCKENVGYKQIVNDTCIKGLINECGKNAETLKFVIETHLKKSNFIVRQTFTLPEELNDQGEIFRHQLNLHIEPRAEVAVLASFPLFLQHYYGVSKLNSILNEL
jgi:hypothetical protein